jgi:hypothetical protein
VVSHHLDGLLLSDRAGLFRPAPDPGVHPVSSRHETGILTVLFLPFEAFPPPTAADPARVRLCGPASRARPLLAVPYTACLAPSPFTPCTVQLSSHRWFPSRWLPIPRPPRLPASAARSRGLEALLHRRVRCSRVRCQTRKPGAPLGLTDSACRLAARCVPSERVGGEALGEARVPARTGMVRQRPLREAVSRSRPPGWRRPAPPDAARSADKLEVARVTAAP